MTRLCRILLVIFLGLAPLRAQTPAPQASPSPVAAAIPLAELASQLESTTVTLAELDKELADDPRLSLEGELGAVIRELDRLLRENTRVLASHPTLEGLRELGDGLRTTQGDLTGLREKLSARAAWLDEQIKRLDLLAEPWEPTLEQARNSSVPAELVGRVEVVLQTLERSRQQAHTQRAQLMTVQDRILVEEGRLARGLEAIAQERTVSVNRIWLRDTPPIWSAPASAVDAGIQASVNAQWQSLAVYCQQHAPRFVVNLILIGLLTLALRAARVWLRPFTREDPDLRRTAEVFRVPFPTAIALSVSLSQVIYPSPPALLVALLGAAALVPTRVILHRMLEPRVLPILDMLVVFYFIDLVRALFAPLTLVGRGLFLTEMAAGAVVLGWLLWSTRAGAPLFYRGLVALGCLIFGLAGGAAATGFLSLGSLLGQAALHSAYVGIVVMAAAQIANGLVMLGIHVPPLGLLGSVRNHRELIRKRCHTLVGLLAGLAWVGFSLEFIGLRQPVLAILGEAFSADLRLGALRFSLGDVLAFPVVLWAAVQLSRFTRFLLDEDIYPRVTLPTGVPYALSTMLHYGVLTIGFLMALSALGIDTSRFTIVAGALGVGVGLGLQNVVNNLVSGFILLFERPFRVGDCIAFRELEGDLMSIGLRASIFKTNQGADVIVPNAMLLSNEVINWTLLGRSTRRMDIDVALPYGVDVKRVTTLLSKVVAMSPYAARSPVPRIVLVDFLESSLRFQVQVWMADASVWSLTRSDVLLRVEAALRAAHIDLPYPHRVLQLESLNPRVLEQLRDWPRKNL